MQQSEISSSAQPRRAAQVVPVELTLHYRYYCIASSVIVLLPLATTMVAAWNPIFANSLLPAFTVLWEHSCLGEISLVYIVCSVILLFSLAPWSKLNKRRQQAARYNLAVRAQAQAGTQSSATTPAPDTFTISSLRNWAGTGALAVISLLLLSIIGLVIYGNWQATLQAVGSGLPVALLILSACLDLAILGVVGGLGVLVAFPPRQQLIITRDGLTCRRGYRTRSILWREARLFALIGEAGAYKQEPVLFYELASKETSIRWPSANKRLRLGGVPAGVILLNSNIHPPELFAQQIQFLNSVVAERTELQLYDLR
ncbi:MAG TPA: hypothetical protein VGD98_20825 [Ktedonobacteraceae bacterium]